MSSQPAPAESSASDPTSASTAPTAAKHPPAACKSPKAWCVMLGVLVFALAFDLTAKALAFRGVAINRDEVLANPAWAPPRHPDVHLLPWDLLDLRLVINRGAVFGIGTNRRFLFIAFTIAALGAGLYLFARRTNERQRLAHVALALILAGGLGNLYDRIVYGVVRDFLHMLPDWHLPFNWHYPRFLGGGSEIFPWVFNCADVLLLTGMALLLFHINALERRRQREEAPQATAQPLS